MVYYKHVVQYYVSENIHMILGLYRHHISDQARQKFSHFKGHPSKII
jgi:hypothetical protein